MTRTTINAPDPASRPVDIDAYLERIGHRGSVDADVETLSALHTAHPQAIPFENLDPFLGRPVALDQASLQAKLLAAGRGGYCYEHNLLMMHVLKTLGFSVHGLAARVLWNRPEGALTARTHMLLRVEAQGHAWLVDVGFGGLTQTAPLLFEADRIQQTPHEPFRIVERDGYFTVQAEVAGEWRSLYRFDMSDHHDVDYAITSHYVSTHPASPFVTSLMAARALPDRRLALSGNRLTTHRRDGSTKRQLLETPVLLADAIETGFGIAIPDRAAFVAATLAKGVFALPA